MLDWKKQGTGLWTRVNPLNSPWFLDDVTEIVTKAGNVYDVIMLPKVDGPWDIHYLDQLLAQLEARHAVSKPILIHAILETAEGVLPRAARECFKWLLCPLMASATDRQASVEAFPLNAGGTYAGELKRVCEENELVISTWSPVHLRNKLRELYWKDGTTPRDAFFLPHPTPEIIDAVLQAPEANWEAAAATIMTTDTFPKGGIATAVIGDRTVTLAGIIKGSGMIAPDMATMLGYIVTDAAVEPGFLQTMLSAANKETFSCITVDSDTSTSDTVLAFATGKAGNETLSSFEDAGAYAFQSALTDLCRQLALLVVRDGEGAQKLIEITVHGAVSDSSAHRIALSIANSPLVKTAIAGEDANWGRVVMAVGKAGEPADRDRLAIRFGNTQVAREGLPVEGYDETPVAKHLKGTEISIGVDLGLGSGRATVWTCDLTHGYISINADYRS